MVEKKVANTILQSNYKVMIGGKEFEVSPPRNATIIRLSELVVNLPVTETEDALKEVLDKGKDSRALGDIIALLVCGEIAPLRLYSLGSISSHFMRNRKFRKVRRAVLYETSPRGTISLLTEILGRQEVGDFFTIIVSLKNANILKSTRGTIVSGPR